MSSLNFAASLVFHHMSFSHIFYSDKKHKNENQPRFCINKGDMRALKCIEMHRNGHSTDGIVFILSRGAHVEAVIFHSCH